MGYTAAYKMKTAHKQFNGFYFKFLFSTNYVTNIMNSIIFNNFICISQKSCSRGGSSISIHS